MSVDQEPATGKGFIYVLSNESMPGLLKVGLTENSVRQRIRELSSDTGVPTDFKLEKAFEIEVSVLRQVEQSIHRRLKNAGFHHRKEFFNISLSVCTTFAEDAIFQVTGVKSPDIVGLAEKRRKEKEAKKKWEAEELARREGLLREANREMAQRREEWLATQEKPSYPSWLKQMSVFGGVTALALLVLGEKNALSFVGVSGLLLGMLFLSEQRSITEEEKRLSTEAARQFPFKSLNDIERREYEEEKEQESHSQNINQETNRVDTQKKVVRLPSDQERERQIQERINVWRAREEQIKREAEEKARQEKLLRQAEVHREVKTKKSVSAKVSKVGARKSVKSRRGNK